jgi:ribonuclease III
MDLEAFSASIGHRFADPSLLLTALTHRSYGATHNERLEFLGDSVLNCVIALELYQRFPELSEGELSRLRSSLVSERALAAIAKDAGFGSHLRLGEGEVKNRGSSRPSMLADALEAMIGAVFLDGGFEAARRTVQTLFREALQGIDPQTAGKDAKTQLQEYLQARRLPLPRYSISAIRGEAHEQIFEVLCEIADLGIAAGGVGTSRRSAEQEAARTAYEQAVRT